MPSMLRDDADAGAVFVTFDELPRIIGRSYSRVHVGRLMQRRQFPSAYRLSPNSVAWRLGDLLEWWDSRPPVVAPAET